jgi:hypothetical protein
MTLDERIVMAARHVETGRLIIARQRALLARGLTDMRGEDLLETFERSQQIFEEDLAALLKAKKGA